MINCFLKVTRQPACLKYFSPGQISRVSAQINFVRIKLSYRLGFLTWATCAYRDESVAGVSWMHADQYSACMQTCCLQILRDYVPRRMFHEFCGMV